MPGANNFFSALLKDFFLWGFIVNFIILIVWFLAYMLAKKFIFKLHQKIFNIDEERLSVIHYQLMGIYKLLIFICFLTPYLVLCLRTS